jgi:LmbE family N-acetylglucosaminyl deacetylase
MVDEWASNDLKPEGKPPTEDDLLQRRRFLELARPDEDITTRIDVRPVMDCKRAAFACHASQIRPDEWQDQEDAEAAQRFEESMGVELFVRVEPEAAPGETESTLYGLE